MTGMPLVLVLPRGRLLSLSHLLPFLLSLVRVRRLPAAAAATVVHNAFLRSALDFDDVKNKCPHHRVLDDHFASPARIAPTGQHSPRLLGPMLTPPSMAQVQGSASWSDLPPELLNLVFLRLAKRADRAFFTVVCRAWCSAARQCRLPPPSPVPWLVLPDGSTTSFPCGETFQLQDKVHYRCSSGEWLLLSRCDGSCFLMNYFTKATMPLPNLSSYSYYQEPVEVHNMEFVLPLTWMTFVDIGQMPIVLSLVVCSTCLVAAILSTGDLCTIALCRPGAASWSVSAHKWSMFLSSMVFFQGKLYALDYTAGPKELITIDIVDEHDNNEPRVSRIGRLIEGDYLPNLYDVCYVHYLVESHGALLMIRRKLSYKIQHGILVPHSNDFQVFEANFEQCLWDEVRTLGNNQALFLGKQYSRAVHVSPYDVSRDCIFFLDDCPNRLVKQTTKSCGVYDMKDEKVYSPMPMLSWKSGKIPATWIFS